MKNRNLRARLNCHRLQMLSLLALGLTVCLRGNAGALEDYVARPDKEYEWRKISQREEGEFTITRLRLVSQQWRAFTWSHDMQVVVPEKVRNPGIAFLMISGDGQGTGQMLILKTLAQSAGAMAAIVTRVPNQPLYEGRKEDALISYTFLKYLETGDQSWPLLFPMVKSAVRAMDAVQEFARKEYKQEVSRFMVGGASKRGWTTWLTAAVDKRVSAMAPMVIDMLNMKTQLQWMEKVYGRQSEMISDYTDLQLQKRMDEPRMVELRGWVDPYSYRQRYTMPKLLLLGSNDPYWTVDSLRHYWSDLPEPKLSFQTPNAGHDLAGGKEALPTLAAFFTMIADGRELPEMEWRIGDGANGNATVSLEVRPPAKAVRLWTADSPDRDFRNDRWSNTVVTNGSAREVTANIVTPSKGYRAFMGEVVLTSPSGQDYKLSTEARVTPDSIK